MDKVADVETTTGGMDEQFVDDVNDDAILGGHDHDDLDIPADSPAKKAEPTTVPPSGQPADGGAGTPADGVAGSIPSDVLGRRVKLDGREFTIADLVRNQEEMDRVLTRANQTAHFQRELEASRATAGTPQPEQAATGEPTPQQIVAFGMRQRWAERTREAGEMVRRMADGEWQNSPLPKKFQEELTEMAQAYPGFMSQATTLMLGVQQLEQAFSELVLDIEHGRQASQTHLMAERTGSIQQRFNGLLDELGGKDAHCEGLRTPEVRQQFTAYVSELFDGVPIELADRYLTPKMMKQLFIGYVGPDAMQRLAEAARSATAPGNRAAAATAGGTRRQQAAPAANDFERELEEMENA